MTEDNHAASGSSGTRYVLIGPDGPMAEAPTRAGLRREIGRLIEERGGQP